MPIEDTIGYTGVDYVIPVSVKKQIKKLVGLLLYRDLDIGRKRSVNCAGSKHRINYN